VPSHAEPARTTALEVCSLAIKSYLEQERELMPVTGSNYLLRARAFWSTMLITNELLSRHDDR
jgi:hypothetical protein